MSGEGSLGWRLRQGCETCGESTIALATGREGGQVAGVCGACGFGWPPGTTGKLHDVMLVDHWCLLFSGRLAPASRSAAEEAFGAEQVVEIAPGEWCWDWEELSDWMEGARSRRSPGRDARG